MKDLYILGGSPCCGKSTIAARLAEAYGFYFYELDRDADEMIARAAERGAPCAARVLSYCADELWGRDPAEQMADEIALYEEIAGQIRSRLAQLHTHSPIIAEGAGFLPATAQMLGLDAQHYFCMTPTRAFQYAHYQKRTWVPQVLKACKDKESAFHHWMERDCLFAEAVFAKAQALGYPGLVVDGSLSLAQTLDIVKSAFRLPDAPGFQTRES